MRHLIIGTVLIALGIWGMFAWWESFGLVMRAMVPFGALLLGLLAILSSYYRLGDGAEFTDLDDEEEGGE
jgi:hypothetical protein